MRRREFVAALAGALFSPLTARAQQAPMSVIGFLSASGEPSPIVLDPFFKGLSETGYAEGRNVLVEYRATRQYKELSTLAADLVRRKVNVIFAFGTSNSAREAKAATTAIPIVFVNGSDPVALGLVASLARPGGNVTGISFLTSVLVAKRLELLQEVVPYAKTIAVIVNPTNARAEADKAALQEAAHKKGQILIVLSAATTPQIETAFATAAHQRAEAVLVNGDAFLSQQAKLLVDLAARFQMPTSYPTRSATAAGGLMSYGDNRQESYRQAGVYVGRILRGEKAADLPVLLPTKFEFVINLKTAKALGLEVPSKLLFTADEVIE
jgi:putative tryptophan/tyrosine transport system substrate-binding protein